MQDTIIEREKSDIQNIHKIIHKLLKKYKKIKAAEKVHAINATANC